MSGHPLFWPARHPAHRVRPVAFTAALILAPIVFALLTFWAFLVPVAAVFFGGIPYLLIGGPVLWSTLQRFGPDANMIGPALAAHLIGTPLLTFVGLSLVDTPTRIEDHLSGIAFMTGFGLIFAPFWGLTFGLLYRKFTR